MLCVIYDIYIKDRPAQSLTHTDRPNHSAIEIHCCLSSAPCKTCTKRHATLYIHVHENARWRWHLSMSANQRSGHWWLRLTFLDCKYILMLLDNDFARWNLVLGYVLNMRTGNGDTVHSKFTALNSLSLGTENALRYSKKRVFIEKKINLFE